MCTRIFSSCAALIAATALAGVAMADTEVVRNEVINTPMVALESYPRVDVEPIPQVLAASGDTLAAPVAWWNNGAQDNNTGFPSQDFFQPDGSTLIASWRAADDCFIKHGFWGYITTVKVRMAISSSISDPTICLEIRADCDGRPDGMPIYTFDGDAILNESNLGASAFAGFNDWEFEVEVNLFVPGYTRLWLSPYGISQQDDLGDGIDGFYNWISSGDGQIQGRMAQIWDGSAWIDVLDCACSTFCTDLWFEKLGHICCLDKNNTPHDTTGGVRSYQALQLPFDTERAADNFQIAPNDRRELCRVVAWMATNCPLEKVFFEIYANDCNMPGSELFYSVEEPVWEDTGADYMGLNIYKFTWADEDFEFLPGRNYWISIVAQGNNSLVDRAYWMYLADNACTINITEGKYRDPFSGDYSDWTLLSEVGFLGTARDFAFQIYTHGVGARSDGGQTADPGQPADQPSGTTGGDLSTRNLTGLLGR